MIFELILFFEFSIDFEKLKEKNKKLKEKLHKVEELNANLQQQLLSAKQFLQMPSGRADVSNQEVISALKIRIVPELSPDEVSLKWILFIKITCLKIN